MSNVDTKGNIGSEQEQEILGGQQEDGLGPRGIWERAESSDLGGHPELRRVS